MTQTIRLSKLHRWTGRKVGHARYEDQVKWAKGGSQPTSSHRGYVMGPVFYRQENSAFNRQSTMAWSHIWVMWHDHRWLSSWLSFCKRSHMTLQNCSAQSLVPNSKWYDTAETVSTMIRQTFETNISSTLHISILDLDFSLVGPRPLYSFLGNEEFRIFGSC